MKKIKILRILNRFNLGGPIYNATYLTKYIDPSKYETLLIGGVWENHEKSGTYILDNENINYHIVNTMRRKVSIFYDIISLIKIIKIINSFKPDIIHTHAAKAGLLGRVASIISFHKSFLVHTYHGNVFEGYFKMFINKFIIIIERILAKKTDRIISISKNQKQDLFKKYKICSEHKINLVPLGFDLATFLKKQNSKRNFTRDELQIKNDEVVVTIIGRVVPIKNHKLFIDVVKYCKNKSKVKIKALVVGDGYEREKCMEYAKLSGLEVSYKFPNKNYDIFFTSWRKDIDNILACTDILSMTSINEGTPVSIIEAMASKKVCISTDVGGVSDLIQDGYNGYISSDCKFQYSKKLLKLIRNKDLRTKMSERAYEKVFKRHNYNVLVENIEKLYSKL